MHVTHLLSQIYLPTKYHQKISKGIGVMECIRFCPKTLCQVCIRQKEKEARFVILACDMPLMPYPQTYQNIVHDLPTHPDLHPNQMLSGVTECIRMCLWTDEWTDGSQADRYILWVWGWKQIQQHTYIHHSMKAHWYQKKRETFTIVDTTT